METFREATHSLREGHHVNETVLQLPRDIGILGINQGRIKRFDGEGICLPQTTFAT